MLAEDAFIRRLPGGIHIQDRIQFDALVTASDLCFVAHDNILTVLRRLNERKRSISRIEVSQLTLNVWSLVDNLYAIQCLSRFFPIALDSRFADFLREIKVACLQRNKYIHLASNIENRAKSDAKQPTPGILSYLRPLTTSEVDRGHYHLVPLGLHHHDTTVSPRIDTNVFPHPTEPQFLTLLAFDYELDISSTMRELDELMEEINAKIEVGTRAAIMESYGEISKDSLRPRPQILEGEASFPIYLAKILDPRR